MKRLFRLLPVLMLALLFIYTPASAESAASSMDMQCSVTPDGDCRVTMTVTLRMEASRKTLYFPLPLDAKNIRMNGASVSGSPSARSMDVDVSRYIRDYVGDVNISFEYTLPKAVQVDKEYKSPLGERRLMLTIPLLCSFEYPVEHMNFTITLPGSITDRPDFNSIYRQGSIASDLNVTINGNQIIGASKAVLNDHDGITMTMVVPKTMFPTVSTYVREGNPELNTILGFAIGAVAYWVVFLFTLPMLPRKAATAPEGVTAGEMGCRLTQAGADLTGMVFSWAQMGYLLIQLDGNGRVLLHKRMDMGNERGPFENKVYRWLFGDKRAVEATGFAYAKLARKVAGFVPNAHNMYKSSSGNITFFRLIACGSMVFCGVCVAMNLTSVRALQYLMAVILGAFGAVCAWLIHGIAYRTHLRGKQPVYIGLGCMAVWMLLGLLCGQFWIPFGCAVGEFAIGYLAAYGSRRSELGRYDASLVLGFRRYMKKLPPQEVSRLLVNDPDYFFNLAPYALSLGVIKAFAQPFGARKLDQCPYLLSRVHGKRTAMEWAQLMADTANLMDTKVRQLQLDSLLHLQFATTAPQSNRPQRTKPKSPSRPQGKGKRR